MDELKQLELSIESQLQNAFMRGWEAGYKDASDVAKQFVKEKFNDDFN